MYSEVKNPFGLRNGRYITVNDLREDERGLACNCVCPLCHDRFEARLGQRRIYHFAHNGEGCDEVAAYLLGLYGFFKDFILLYPCPVPELNVYYQIDPRTYLEIDETNYTEQLRLHPFRGAGIRIKSITREMHLKFDSAEIVMGKNKRPEALLAGYHGKRIAFVISPPDTVCKNFSAKPYRDVATLEIQLSKSAELISGANTEKMNAIFSDIQNYFWLSNPLVLRSAEEVNKERRKCNEAYQAEQKRLQEEALRKAEEAYKERQEAERQRQEERREQEQREAARKEEFIRKQQEERAAKLAETEKRKRELFQTHPEHQAVNDYLSSHDMITADFTVIQSDNTERRYARSFETKGFTYEMDRDRFHVGDTFIYMNSVSRDERIRLRGSSAMFIALDFSYIDQEDLLKYLDHIFG